MAAVTDLVDVTGPGGVTDLGPRLGGWMGGGAPSGGGARHHPPGPGGRPAGSVTYPAGNTGCKTP
jgi:hypothetical protein